MNERFTLGDRDEEERTRQKSDSFKAEREPVTSPGLPQNTANWSNPLSTANYNPLNPLAANPLGGPTAVKKQVIKP